MSTEQGALFDQRTYRGQKPPALPAMPPTADQTVLQTLPAYYDHLRSRPLRGSKPSEHTPGNYRADMELFGQFTKRRPLSVLQTADLKQWIASLSGTMKPKTINQKVSALGNYFRWLISEGVLEENPAGGIQARRVTAPTRTLLYESECDELLRANSSDPRTYLLILLLLETGMKKAELLELEVADFDFSDKYLPIVQVKHSGDTFKDRKNKLEARIAAVFEDYVQRYHIAGRLFPLTPRSITTLLHDAGKRAKTTKPVTASMLRDICVVRGVKSGRTLEEMFVKIGLSKDSYDDARKKYARLTSEAL